MTYVPNTIRISSHGIDFSHQVVRFEERTQNRNRTAAKWVEEKEGRKKEIEQEERKRDGSPILPVSHVMVIGATLS
jgi:hypothetical protein